MEEFFLDQRTYLDGSGSCGAPVPTAAATDSFALACTATATSFTYSATGAAAKGMDAFAFTIDDTGAKATLSVPRNWARTANCWTVRADGSCG
jgi:type IV pilus assembly protein PilE